MSVPPPLPNPNDPLDFLNDGPPRIPKTSGIRFGWVHVLAAIVVLLLVGVLLITARSGNKPQQDVLGGNGDSSTRESATKHYKEPQQDVLGGNGDSSTRESATKHYKELLEEDGRENPPQAFIGGGMESWKHQQEDALNRQGRAWAKLSPREQGLIQQGSQQIAPNTEVLDTSTIEGVMNWCATQNGKIGELENKNHIRSEALKKAKEDELKNALAGQTFHWELKIEGVDDHTVKIAKWMGDGNHKLCIISAKEIDEASKTYGHNNSPSMQAVYRSIASQKACTLDVMPMRSERSLGTISREAAAKLDAEGTIAVSVRIIDVGIIGNVSNEIGWIVLDRITVGP